MSEGDSLIALGELDLAIARTAKALDELPEKKAVLQIRKRQREVQAVRDRAGAYCKQANKVVTEANDKAASLQTKIDAEQAKVLSGEVTNSKELQSLTRELDALKRQKDAIEYEELSLIEKAETAEQQLAKVDAALAELAASEAKAIEVYRSRGGEVQTEIGRLTRERKKAVSALPADLRARYESVREAKHGIAVGILQGPMCSACRTQIPASQLQSVQSGPEISECPVCRRLLVVRRDV